MSSQKTAVQAFEDALQLHENEIVIELAPDRVLHFLGVRLIIILAIAAKLTEVLLGNLTCHPTGNVTSVGKGFIAFSQTYCWESPVSGGTYTDSSSLLDKLCQGNTAHPNFTHILSKPEVLLNLQRWIPFAFLFEACLYALPSAWWHFRVGGRLMGHLKFMKLLLQRIYEQLKTVPVGIAKKGCPYDKESCHLDGYCNYNPERPEQSKGKNFIQESDIEATLKGEKITQESLKLEETKNRNQTDGGSMLRDEPWNTSTQSASNSDEASDNEDNPNRNQTDGESMLQDEPRNTSTQSAINSDEASDNDDDPVMRPKKLLDRHLFSILCYENFSSLEQHPYILSVVQLTFFKETKEKEDLLPMDEAILRQWCHKSNFSGRFLVVRYYIKLLLGIIIDLAMLRTMGFILEFLGKEAWHADSYLCDVILHADDIMVCTMHRRTEVLAILVLNIIIILLHLIISVVQMFFISRSYNLAVASFFEYINDLGSIGMLVALREKQAKQKKKKGTST